MTNTTLIQVKNKSLKRKRNYSRSLYSYNSQPSSKVNNTILEIFKKYSPSIQIDYQYRYVTIWKDISYPISHIPNRKDRWQREYILEDFLEEEPFILI
jgi:hypothetical protein